MADFLNRNLKYLRSNKGISQQDLADKIGIDRSTISRIENNEIDTTVDNAIKIANILQVPVSDLLSKDLTKCDDSYNELDEVLFSKAKDLSDEDKKAVINIINAIKKEIDEETNK